MLRATIGYSLSDRATIGVGYTWLPTQNLGKSSSSQVVRVMEYSKAYEQYSGDIEYDKG